MSPITWRQTADPLPCTPKRAGTGFVVAKWGDIVVVRVYIPPGRGRTFFENRLDLIGGAIREHAPSSIIVAGDFNAHSRAWGSRRTDLRGGILEGWAASLGLHLLNEGTASTCVRPQGESVVDLTWATAPAAARVVKWQVVGELTDTDHRYIEVVLGSSPAQTARRRLPRPRRWVLRKLDEDRFLHARGALARGGRRGGGGRWGMCGENKKHTYLGLRLRHVPCRPTSPTGGLLVERGNFLAPPGRPGDETSSEADQAPPRGEPRGNK